MNIVGCTRLFQKFCSIHLKREIDLKLFSSTLEPTLGSGKTLAFDSASGKTPVLNEILIRYTKYTAVTEPEVLNKTLLRLSSPDDDLLSKPCMIFWISDEFVLYKNMQYALLFNLGLAVLFKCFVKFEPIFIKKSMKEFALSTWLGSSIFFWQLARIGKVSEAFVYPLISLRSLSWNANTFVKFIMMKLFFGCYDIFFKINPRFRESSKRWFTLVFFPFSVSFVSFCF